MSGTGNEIKSNQVRSRLKEDLKGVSNRDSAGKRLRQEIKDRQDIKAEEKNNNKPKEKTYEAYGYNFKSKEEAEAAKDEHNAIKYLSDKIDSKDITQVYKLYNMIIDRQLFSTPVGYNYLKELQQYLYVNKDIPNDKIRPIPIKRDTEAAIAKRKERMEHRSELYTLSMESARYKDRFIKAMIVNVCLAIVIIGMIIILATSSNPTIIDYEVKLQNKYAQWQEELQSEEASIKARENSITSNATAATTSANAANTTNTTARPNNS